MTSPVSMRKPYAVKTWHGAVEKDTYRLECCRDIRIWRGIVESDTTIIAWIELVRHLRNALVAAIAGSKVQICGPVVREIFREMTRRA